MSAASLTVERAIELAHRYVYHLASKPMSTDERAELLTWIHDRAKPHAADHVALEDISDTLRIHVADAENLITKAGGWPS